MILFNKPITCGMLRWWGVRDLIGFTTRAFNTLVLCTKYVSKGILFLHNVFLFNSNYFMFVRGIHLSGDVQHTWFYAHNITGKVMYIKTSLLLLCSTRRYVPVECM